MFYSTRARRQKRNARAWRPPEVRCRPTVEVLEDRCVPSATPNVLAPPDNGSQILILFNPSNNLTATAGLPFAGVVATLASTGPAPTSALITWGDGHTSAGLIASTSSGYTITGSNAYDHTGTYTVSVTVVTAGGNEVVLQEQAVVFAGVQASIGLSAASETLYNWWGNIAGSVPFSLGTTVDTVTFSDGNTERSTGPQLVNVPQGPTITPASGASSPPVLSVQISAQGQTFSGSGQQPPPLVFTGFRAAPVTSSQQAPWTPLHEYGGNRPAVPLLSTTFFIAPASTLVQSSGERSSNNAAQGVTPGLPLLGTPLRTVRDTLHFLSSNTVQSNLAYDDAESAMVVAASYDAEVPEDDRTAVNVATSVVDGETSEGAAYHRPFHEVAERGDLVRLIDLPGTVYVPTAGFGERGVAPPASLPPHAETPAPSQASSAQKGQSLFARLGRTLFPVAATWGVLQALYTGTLRTPSRRGKPILLDPTPPESP